MSLLDLKVVRSAIRCPWCHGELTIASLDWVACRECLARHHGECWEERRACAACGAVAHLVSVPAPSRPMVHTPARPLEFALRELQQRQAEIEVALAELEATWDRERRGMFLTVQPGPWVEPYEQTTAVLGFFGATAVAAM